MTLHDLGFVHIPSHPPFPHLLISIDCVFGTACYQPTYKYMYQSDICVSTWLIFGQHGDQPVIDWAAQSWILGGFMEPSEVIGL